MAWTAPRTWVTDELVTAAIMNTHVRDNLSFLKSVQDTLVTYRETVTAWTEFATNAASVTPFTSTPDGFNILDVVLGLRSDAAAQNFDDIQLDVNDDASAGVYNSVTMGAFDSLGTDTLFVTNDNTSGYWLAATTATGATATTDFLGVLHLRIYNYTSTTQFKHVIGTRLAIRDASNLTTYQVGQFGGIWESTSKITKLEVVPATGSNFTGGFYAAWASQS